MAAEHLLDRNFKNILNNQITVLVCLVILVDLGLLSAICDIKLLNPAFSAKKTSEAYIDKNAASFGLVH